MGVDEGNILLLYGHGCRRGTVHTYKASSSYGVEMK